MTALTDLCENNKAEMGDTSARYFPFMNQNDGVCNRRMKALNNKSRVQHDLLVASSSNYMNSIFKLHQTCHNEYQRHRQLMIECNQKEAWYKTELRDTTCLINRERKQELTNQLNEQFRNGAEGS